MPMSMQKRLLRVIENGEVTRLGSNDVIKVNVRILSATNCNLEEAITAGTFRQDLYYRLKVVTVRIPPIRERAEDIPVLLDHFVRQFAKKHDKTIKGITAPTRKLLFDFDWPGNVRQLRNAVESMVVVDYDGMIDIDDLPEEIGGALPITQKVNRSMVRDVRESESLSGSLNELVGKPLSDIERQFIKATLQALDGNREEAAKVLDIGERTLYRKIKEYGIMP
jgi:two-component system response regulator HydG